MPEINTYRNTFQAKHGNKAPPFIISDFIVCVDTEEKVTEYTDKYFAAQFYQVVNHYEWGGDHFKIAADLFDLCRAGRDDRSRGRTREGLQELSSAAT